MTYIKDLNITIDCWSDECFRNNRKKTTDMKLKFELNKNFERNTYLSQMVIMRIDDVEVLVSVSELENALQLLKDVHNAGR